MIKDFFDFTQGCEAIDFQIQSKLFKDLVNVFNMGFEFRETIDVGPVVNRGELAMRNYKAMEMSSYVKKFMMPEFTKAVYLHTGLTVSKVTVHANNSEGPVGMYAVDLSFGDWQSASVTMDRVTGITNDGKMTDSLKEFQDMSNHFDTHTGKITEKIFGKNKKYAVRMYFDALYSYCLKDFVNNYVVEEFNAEELAAIMLHEIGHALSFAERAGDLYFQQKRLIDHLAIIKKQGDIEKVVEENYPIMKQNLQSLIKNKDIDRKHVAFLIKTLDKVKDVSSKLDEIPADTSLVIISGIKLLLKTVFTTIALLIAIMEIIVIFRPLIEWFVSYRIGQDNRDKKTSDTFTTTMNMRWCERMADEFVSRHGASRYLASGLAKFTNNKVTFGNVDSKILRESILVSMYIKFMSLVFNMLSYVLPNYTYEEDVNRLKRIAQNTIATMKSNNLPYSVQKDLVEDYECVINSISKIKGVTDTDIFKILEHIVSCFIDIPTIIRNFTSGNIARDYEKLSDQIDELLNNKLYYQSIRLNVLASSYK